MVVATGILRHVEDAVGGADPDAYSACIVPHAISESALGGNWELLNTPGILSEVEEVEERF
jgi:hypothetical protein